MILLILGLGSAMAITREAALDQAAAYAIHSWTMTSANTTASCSSSYESDYSAGTYTGLPYDWGGYMSLDEFDAQIAAGYGAGSHSWHGILTCTAGVDCSGYVSQVWDTGHYSTSTFSAVTDEISISAVERADAFNDPGSHIVLYAYETAAGVPVFYEAAGSASRVRVNASSGWSYLSGYTPIRFEDIEDGGVTGTEGEPIQIRAFPYSDTRWTAGAASDALDRYACAPDTDESGPEMLYHFHTPTGGHLEAVVSDDSGVDIDLHVLTAADADACLARDDSAVSLDVPAGDVWLSLDTYVSSREYPGPYVLSVTFDGEVTGSGSSGGDDPEDTGATGEDPGEDGEVVGSGRPDGWDGGAADDGGDSGDDLPPRDEPRGKTISGEDAGGCSTGGGGARLGLAALAALALTRRRRAR